MPTRKKFPAISTAPLTGESPELNIPTNIFGVSSGSQKYDSAFFNEIDGFVNHARHVHRAVRENGKGVLLFPDEKQFLAELDNALFHYEMFRPIVTGELCGTLNEQREYFQSLKRKLQIKSPSQRSSRVQEILIQRSECDTRRLVKTGFDATMLQRLQASSGMANKASKQEVSICLKQLETAADTVLSELKNKNSGRHAELYLLIEQLADMYEACTNKKPSVTYNEHYPDNKGVFFDLVKFIIPVCYFSNKEAITDSAIIEGIRLL